MWNDNGSNNEADLYLNYTVKNESRFSQTKIRLPINNLFDKHNIVAVEPASTASNLPAPGDQITMLAARSVSLWLTFGVAPRK